MILNTIDEALSGHQQHPDIHAIGTPSPTTTHDPVFSNFPSPGLRTPESVSSTSSSQCAQEPIAIVSVACRLPGHCMNPQQLWEFLLNGGVATSNSPPESRFSIKGHFDGSRKTHTMISPGGMFIEDIDLQAFDAQFFNINRADTIAMDPQQRQILEVVYECLENGGLSLESLSGQPIGCFVASHSVDFGDIQSRDPEDRAGGISMGVGRSILSNRVSHFLNIKGPSMTIDTACSGSLASLDVACKYLQAGLVEGAIIASAAINLDPEHTIESGSLRGTISQSGKCHTFDSKADGYVKAEAVSSVFVKRLKDAIRDGDPIRAVIRGTSANHNGRTPGIASPSSAEQAAAARAAYAQAGITDLNKTGYLECHGTGTPTGDPIETTGAGMVFGSLRPADDPLIIGSIKSNIGHSENAAGLSGILKTTMVVERGIIPGNPTFITPSPKINFKELHIRPSRVAINWPQSTSAYRRASVNSFGFGGANSHGILDCAEHFMREHHMHQRVLHTSSYAEDDDDFWGDDDEDETADLATRPQVLVFSANTLDSLKAYLKKLRAHLLNPKVSIKLSDLTYTLSERRTRLYHRGYAIVSGGSETKVSDLQVDAVTFGKQAADTPKVGFIFTGQGAQWPQMGRDLLNAFPEVAGSMIKRLDKALQTLSPEVRPAWSIYSELTESRTSEHMRLPEFSQPLVTALQLALAEVLKLWGVTPQAVVGHSSGEIAAACTAGFITPEQAIKVAYLRGYAGKEAPASEPLSMMAVGMGPDKVQSYLDVVNVEGEKPAVQIACYNSPSSITLAGTVGALNTVGQAIKADGHFARLLQVNLAYHSQYMGSISDAYERLLTENHCLDDLAPTTSSIKMFSSVTREILGFDAQTGVSYWKANMVSPVRFADACQQLMKDQDNGADFLIELGPSNALSGPVGQIKKQLPNEGSNITYVAAAKRGAETLQALYAVAGQMFISGAGISLPAVNNGDGKFLSTSKPSTIIDLPNYSWNHSTRYWHESEISKEWRFRKFVHHDLLGSKVLGSSWNAPSWRKFVKLADLPWIRDHRMGTDVIFPGSAYIAMAIEAVYQTTVSVSTEEELHQLTTQPYHYQLRDINFHKALVLDEANDAHIMLNLTPLQGLKSKWYKYEVTSIIGGEVLSTTTHSTGFVRLNKSEFKNPPAESDALDLPLRHPTPAKLWYSSLGDAGYEFGKTFQKKIQVESVLGVPKGRSLLSLEAPESKWTQSYYPLHPVAMDGCFQTVSPSLWDGDRSSPNDLLVPGAIDAMYVAALPTDRLPEVGLSLASSKYLGRGRIEDKIHYSSYCSVYNPETKEAIFKMEGLRYHRLESHKHTKQPYPYTRLEWKPDLSFLQDQSKYQAALDVSKGKGSSVHNLIDFAAHKLPHLAVLEINLVEGDTSSLWLEKPAATNATRAACRAYNFVSKHADALLEAEKLHAGAANTKFTLLNHTDAAFEPSADTYDLIIVKVPTSLSNSELEVLAANVEKQVAEQGHALYVPVKVEVETNEVQTSLTVAIQGTGLVNVQSILEEGAEVAVVASKASPDSSSRPAAALVQLPGAASSDILAAAKTSLSDLDFDITDYTSSFADVPKGSTVLVVDELVAPLLATATEEQWDAIKDLVRKECNIVWVTQGAQLEVTNPTSAIAQGIFRSIRSEEPLLNIITLDVESNEADTLPRTFDAVAKVLKLAQNKPTQEGNDFEFVERGGILYIPRILADEGLHAAQVEAEGTGRTVTLHESKSTIRLITGKRGDIDSLHWSEIGPSDSFELEPGSLEVEVYASSLNFKDVIVAMGIIPENEHLLGIDGAGIVRRVAPDVTDRHVGQRVAVLKRGTLANRVIARREDVMPIPDSLPFEEAATMPLVFVTSMESLFGLANIKPGHKVLIHSAAGGVGISSIQLCQYVGCEVYATVGSDDKRQFLKDSFGIADDHIFSSRSTKFAKQILEATNGYGVDVIVNSLTGELLEESWRIIAHGGTMVELGKHDILERGTLPMEPFGRNASFRALDVSLESFKKEVIEHHLDHLAKLIDGGHVKPITPMKVYSFEEIGDAFRFLGSGKHIGKLIISNGANAEKSEVTVHPPQRSFTRSLNPDHSYLIVGGLRGLCGSLAEWLAKNGAKHLAVMSRSGSADEKSLGVIKNVEAQGCAIELLKGDVANVEDVRRCLSSTSVPIGGIVQGAMVLRDRMFDSMTHREYHEALACKVQGTWNLHTVSQELNLPLSFFTMLSSISGIVGQKGQANYSGGNTFLDSLAVYRRNTLGLPAHSINLGIIEGIGYLVDHDDVHKQLTRNLDTWAPINEAKLRRVFEMSVYQQDGDVSRLPNPASATQMITGMNIPLPDETDLYHDARFTGLHITTGKENEGAKGGDRDDKELQTFLLLLRTKGSDPVALLNAAVSLTNNKFVKLLRLPEPMEPSRPMSIYGLDSLVAVEFRNWARTTLSVELSTLEITNALSLIALCEKIITKAAAALAA